MREIYIKDPEGEYEFDGYEKDTESEEDMYQREWENSTYLW